MGESQEAFDRLRLIRSENIGPVTYQQMIRRFGSAARALEAIPDMAKRGGGRSPRIADPKQIDSEMKRFTIWVPGFFSSATPDIQPC